jgi:ABC-type spermidine/putrescine transport system permease subunit II
MNRSLYIVLVPALLVATGYIIVFRHLGLSPGYLRLIGAMVLFFGGIFWLGRRRTSKAK